MKADTASTNFSVPACRVFLSSVWLMASFFLCANPASAGGYKIQDQSARGMGRSNAFVAGANDASAVYYNPAGLVHLERTEIVGNVYSAWSEIDHEGPSGEHASKAPVYVLPNIYTGGPLKENMDLYWGMGVNSPFGLGTRWGSDTPMAATASIAEIELANFNPSLAWHVTDTLSLGVGANYFLSRAEIEMYPPALRGGEQTLSGIGDGWGHNLGLKWRVLPDHTFALTYRSEVTGDYDGDAEYRNVPLSVPIPNGTYDMETEIEFPALTTIAWQWEATEYWRMEVAAEHQDWSTRDKQTYVIGPPINKTQTQELNWKDSWVFMLGSEYDLNDKWTVRGGYGYSETPVPSSTAEASMPTGDTHVVSTGFGYRFSERLSLDSALVLAYGEENTIDHDDAQNAGFDGDYESISAFFSVGARYRF